MNKKMTAAKPAERTRVAKVTVPEPELIEAPMDASPAVEVSRAEVVAPKAYDFFRASMDGDFPDWDEVTQRGRNLYEDAARHVIDGGEPRTDFERVVVEVLHG